MYIFQRFWGWWIRTKRVSRVPVCFLFFYLFRPKWTSTLAKIVYFPRTQLIEYILSRIGGQSVGSSSTIAVGVGGDRQVSAVLRPSCALIDERFSFVSFSDWMLAIFRSEETRFTDDRRALILSRCGHSVITAEKKKPASLLLLLLFFSLLHPMSVRCSTDTVEMILADSHSSAFYFSVLWITISWCYVFFLLLPPARLSLLFRFELV